MGLDIHNANATESAIAPQPRLLMQARKRKRVHARARRRMRQAVAAAVAFAVLAAASLSPLPATAAYADPLEDAERQAIADEVFGDPESDAPASALVSPDQDDDAVPASPAAPAASAASESNADSPSDAIREIAVTIVSEGPALTKEQKAQLLNRIDVMKGDPDRGLMLDIMVRRSDAAVFFARLLGQEQAVIDGAETTYSTAPFPDTPQGMWYTPYISYCVGIGLIVGRTDGKYYPDDNISEKEFANVLLKILGYVYEDDYDWDTVYEFAYDIGLFDDPAYATRVEDNREYYRRDVCNEVFAVLGLEKKDSPLKLLEELVETGALSSDAVIAMGLDIATLVDASGSGLDDGRDLDDFADIEEVYHLDRNLIWVIFTKAVTIKPENIEISQTYDFSMTLDAEIVESSAYDLVIRTSEQEPNMDYTIDIGNVIESDGTNAGMLSFDFVGFDPNARTDDLAGPTSKERDPAALAAERERQQQQQQGAGNSGEGGGGGAGGGAAAGSGPQELPLDTSGNADVSTEYFRVVNAYTVSSNQAVVFFSQPITDAALSSTLYNVYHDGANVSSGASRQIRAELMDNAANAVRLTSTGLTYRQGMQYTVTVSSRLASAYTARLNEGYDDSYVFTASSVAETNEGFTLKSVSTPSQYAIDLTFTQPVNPDVARQQYVYHVEDHNGRRVDISGVSLMTSAGAGGASGGAAAASAAASASNAVSVRLSVSQQLTQQGSYTLTVVYMENASRDEEIKNLSNQFRFTLGSGGAVNSQIEVTSAASPDPSVVEVYFSEKPDKSSAEATTNYTLVWQAATGMPSGSVAPAKATYDPVLSPYMVRLYFPPDSRMRSGVAYTLRVGTLFRDADLASPSKALEAQFYTDGEASPNPSITDAAVVGENIVRLTFSKEIRLDQQILSDANYVLEDATGAASSGVVPTLVKYVDPQTIILKFDGGSTGADASSGGMELGRAVETGRRYRVRVVSLTDITGMYSSKYPDPGTTINLRAGKR